MLLLLPALTFLFLTHFWNGIKDHMKWKIRYHHLMRTLNDLIPMRFYLEFPHCVRCLSHGTPISGENTRPNVLVSRTLMITPQSLFNSAICGHLYNVFLDSSWLNRSCSKQLSFHHQLIWRNIMHHDHSKAILWSLGVHFSSLFL